MSFILEQLSERAQTLPPDERAQLAEDMLRSLSSQTDSTVDAEWSVEIRRRVSEIQNGSAPLVSVDNLIAQIRRTFA
jgi:putative addiction module component (TIGR02574 family)